MTETTSSSRERERSRAAAERDRRFALLVAMLAQRGRLRWRGPKKSGPGWERPMDNERPVVTEANKDRVRAGVTGHNVRYVLLAGCALVVIAYAIIYFVMK